MEGTFGSHGPTPLSSLGERQAIALTTVLTKLDAIYASDLPRAMATAAPTATGLAIPVATDARLRERNVGRFEGLTFFEAEQQFPKEYAALMSRDPDARPPGGETHHECRERMAAAVDAIVQHHGRGRVAVISHAMALNQVLRSLLGIPVGLRAPWFRTDNCGIHHLQFEPDGRMQILALNARAHLAGL